MTIYQCDKCKKRVGDIDTYVVRPSPYPSEGCDVCGACRKKLQIVIKAWLEKEE